MEESSEDLHIDHLLTHGQEENLLTRISDRVDSREGGGGEGGGVYSNSLNYICFPAFSSFLPRPHLSNVSACSKQEKLENAKFQPYSV